MRLFSWLASVRSPDRNPATGPSARLQLESLEDRTTPYSVSGNLWPHPELITVSFVPDGTLVNGVASNLQSTFNTKFGSAATWQNVFKDAAQAWAQQTNINFNFISDSGVATGSGNYMQGDPTIGDIRIGGYSFGSGNTTLAQAFMPPQVNNYSIAGDIAFNTAQTFNIGSAYNLFTVASHEIGHALGLNHGAVGAIMASAYPGTLNALTSDDISGIRTIYSAGAARSPDSYDAVASNDTSATASLVTSVINTTTKAGVINNMDLSTSTDVDWYKFVVPTGSSTKLSVKAVATGLSMLDPKIDIYDSTATLKASGNAAVYGGTAATSYTGIAAGQTWYVRVSSADAKADFKTGRYALILNMGTGADPAITLPVTQTAKGTTLTSGGGIAINDGVETQVTTSGTTGGLAANMSVIQGGAVTTVSTGQPKLSMDQSGNYVVVWPSSGLDGSGWGIYAQRYNSSGIAQGSAFQVNTTTAGDQVSPAVAMQANGSFVVVWASNGQDGSGWGVYAQRFDATGTAVGTEFRVNTTTAGDQLTPSVGIDASGNFVVAWASYGQDAANSWGIYAQRYNSSGVAQGSEFRVNTTTTGDQIAPIVSMSSSLTLSSVLNFVIGWSSYGQDATNSWGVYAQRYNSSGVAQGTEFRVNTTTTGDQQLTDIGVDASGNFIPVWTSVGQDGDKGGIYAEKINNLGTVVINEFRVNTTTVGDQTGGTVATDKYGNFTIIWSSNGQDGSGWGVYGQQFTSAAVKIESEFRVNSTTAGDQMSPTAKMDSLGHLVVVWNGATSTGSNGVFLQRYSVNTAAEHIAPVSDSWDPTGDDDAPASGSSLPTFPTVALAATPSIFTPVAFFSVANPFAGLLTTRTDAHAVQAETDSLPVLSHSFATALDTSESTPVESIGKVSFAAIGPEFEASEDLLFDELSGLDEYDFAFSIPVD